MIFSRYSRSAAAHSLVTNIAATAPVNLPQWPHALRSRPKIVAAENGAATHRTDTIAALDRRSWVTKQELANAIFEWIEVWYNPARRHSALGYHSPLTYERMHHSPPTAAA